MRILLFIITIAASSHTLSAESAIRTYTPDVLYKNYAFSSCLADAFDDKMLRKDASATAAAYLEFGTGPLEAYTEATLLGREYLSREYKGKSSASLATMKCIDFYHSAKLDELTDKYFSKTTK